LKLDLDKLVAIASSAKREKLNEYLGTAGTRRPGLRSRGPPLISPPLISPRRGVDFA
jgi:hypothetical protein